MKIIKTFNIVLVLLALSALPAHAGWVETNQQQEVNYYGNGMMKQVPSPEDGGPETIMDFNKGTVTLVDHRSRTFTSFKFEEFCDYLMKMFAAYPPDMLAAMKKENASKPRPSVSIKKAGKGETIAGYATTKYQVNNNGVLERTVWMAEDARLKKYTGAYFGKAMDNSIRKMSRCDGLGISGEDVSTSTPYFNLMKNGWVMKEELVDEDSMEGSSAPVVKLVEKNLPASTFSVPKGYRKVPMAQFNMGN